MSGMRNMKIRAKLISGFLIVVILALVLGLMSIYGLNTLSNNETELYEVRVQALYQAEEIEIALHQQRIAFRDMEIYHEDPEHLASAEERLARYQGNFTQGLDDYKAALGEEDTHYTSVKNAYENEYLPVLNEYLAALEADDLEGADAILDEITVKVDMVEEAIAAMVTDSDAATDATQAADTVTANNVMLIVIILSAVAVVAGVFLALLNAKMIATPAGELVKAAKQISEGDLDVNVEVGQRDEIGTLADAFHEMITAFREQARVLTAIAEGDYTGDISVRGEKDMVNRAISAMLENNNAMIAEIRTAAEQVSAGAAQIADGAQSLATGSTQQAATLEEFSASINQVQSQSERNTELANSARGETDEAGRLMNESLQYMSDMTEAMKTIDESSQNIAKVIKVIDDIAFQTNILALNAAVEAARAGQHGKGFAVVADEVRNLASKSAAAAKETADLIQNSVDNVARGTKIAQQTSESLAQVGEIAASNAASISEMSESSQQQSVAISEINQGIGQISQVVQANSATAEESAASAEELSAQSALLNKTVSQFKLRDGVADAGYAAQQAPQLQYVDSPAALPQASGEEPLF